MMSRVRGVLSHAGLVVGLAGFLWGLDRVVGGCVLFVIRWVFDAEWGSCDL